MASNEGDRVNVPQEVSYIITIIIGSDTYPFTVLLNLLMIMAVKQDHSYILLACLVVTDTLTGLLDQSSYILWRIFQLLGLSTSETAENLHFNFMSLPWKLHAFIQCGLPLRDLSPSNVRRTTVSDRKITTALIAVWIIAFVCRMFEALEMYLIFLF